MDKEGFVINVTAEPGKPILLGNEIISLEDTTTDTFKAVSRDSLVDYIKALKKREGHEKGYNVFVELGLGSLAALIEVYEDKKSIHSSNKVAIYGIDYHPAILEVLGLKGVKMNLKSFADFLRRLKSYGADNSCLDLLSDLDNLKVNKVVSIENHRNSKGDFNYSVKSENQSPQDYQFPNEVSFRLPLYKGFDNCNVLLKFDLMFDWHKLESIIEMQFQFENFGIDDLIYQRHIEVLGASFGDVGNVYFGALKLYKSTNRELLYVNDLKISTR